jgi:predicted DNA-binding transcriptional regulator AlpA
LIDAAAAAKLLGTKIRWLYDRADDLPFTRRIGPRTLRFDEAGIRRWLETRK